MQEEDQIDEASHAGVKGEFVRISVPPDGIRVPGKEDLVRTGCCKPD